MRLLAYGAERESEWNKFVEGSKNGTFLFHRNFMDYHSCRFKDASLLFYNPKGRVAGLLPANAEGDCVYSHGGLTYGGFVLDGTAVQATVDEMLSLATDYYLNECGAKTLVYKPTPYIYHSLPSQEDLYALFRAGAVLTQRCVSSTLCPANHPKQRQSRRGGVVRAMTNGVAVEEVKDASARELDEFHSLLERMLLDRHATTPVHSLAEMRLLTSRFPENIKLFVARRNGTVVAGSWVFETPLVAHTQYIASNTEGKRFGAGDMLIDWLISERYADKKLFDFGISTERGGMFLNRGLIFEKEGFGARSVCYDTYMLDLSKANGNLKELI